MIIKEEVSVPANKEQIWRIISDIRHSQHHLTSVKQILIIEQPRQGLKGLKWQETWKLPNSTCTETVWITGSEKNDYYSKRFEFQSLIYNFETRIVSEKSHCKLVISLEISANTLMADITACLFPPLVLENISHKMKTDLVDYKKAVMESIRP